MENRVWSVMLRRSKESWLLAHLRWQLLHSLIRAGRVLVDTGVGHWLDIHRLKHLCVVQSGDENCWQSPSGNTACVLNGKGSLGW